MIHREKEVEATISTVEEDPERRATREAQLQFSQEAEIRAVTSPEFILFLANSALSSYRSLHNTGLSSNNYELLYSSFIFLPLSIEYFIKYLLLRSNGSFEDKHKTHRLLELFDYLSFDLQKSFDAGFKNELEEIGRKRSFVID